MLMILDSGVSIGLGRAHTFFNSGLKRTFNLEYTVEHHHISNYIPTRFTVQNQAGSAGLAAAVYCCLQLLPIHIPHHMYCSGQT